MSEEGKRPRSDEKESFKEFQKIMLGCQGHTQDRGKGRVSPIPWSSEEIVSYFTNKQINK